MSAVEEQSIAGERSRQVSAEEQSRMRVQQSRVGERSRAQSEHPFPQNFLIKESQEVGLFSKS